MAIDISCQITQVSTLKFLFGSCVHCIYHFWLYCFFAVSLFIVYIMFHSMIYPVLRLLYLGMRLSRCNKAYLLTYLLTMSELRK